MKAEEVVWLSPLVHTHINFQGQYSFVLSDAVATVNGVRSVILTSWMHSLAYPRLRRREYSNPKPR